MSLFQRIFGGTKQRAALQPLYAAVVATGRAPDWYRDGQVPDTIEGRFDMIAAILSLVLLRLEQEGEATRNQSVLLTEIFIDDMDGQLREIGVGDVVVGKHLGRMMSALGGRLGAYRDAFEGRETLETVLERNLYRGVSPDPAALAWATERLRAVHGAITAMPAMALLDGEWPEL